MNKLIVTLTMATCLVASGFAMEERLEQINAIKKNKDFLYGEATMMTQQEAATLAYDALHTELLAWASQQDSTVMNHIMAQNVSQVADTIMMRRADKFRVFAYVRKSDLLPSSSLSPSHSSPAPQSKQHRDSIVTDSVKQIILERFFHRQPNDALYRIKQARNFFELKGILQPLKEEGKISAFGKYATAEHPEECYLIVYDPAGNIKALLGKGKKIRPNLKTGKDDTLENYRGCGAIWFLLNEIVKVKD